MSDDVRTDAELLSATTRGDDDAFAVLVLRYIRAATLLCAQLLGDRDEAEDIVQDSFTVVYKKASSYDASRPFPPWFFAIVRRLALNRRSRDLRRARLLRLLASRLGMEPPPGWEPEPEPQPPAGAEPPFWPPPPGWTPGER